MTVSDEARFASLYELHQHRVTAYVRRRTEIDSVDDLTAEVFLTVWRKIDEAPEGDDAIRWLYRISYLVLTNHWRRSGRNRRLDRKLESIGIEASVSADEQVVMRQELRDVLEAASRLRPGEQEILRLSLWEHLSHEDIGAVLGIEANTAKQRLHRARKALVREHERMYKPNKRLQQSPAAQEGGEW